MKAKKFTSEEMITVIKDKNKLTLSYPFTHQAQTPLVLSCEIDNHLHPNIYKKIFTVLNNLTNV